MQQKPDIEDMVICTPKVNSLEALNQLKNIHNQGAGSDCIEELTIVFEVKVRDIYLVGVPLSVL